ncbi:uncharacterized protein ACBT44_007139 isoform 2-T2 [Syngnathus typhle]
METYQKESLRRIRQNSQMLLQDLFSSRAGGRNTSLDDLTARSGKDDLYLPAVTRKASLRGNLSQSCPYLSNSRRGSFSSVSSCTTGGHCNKQKYLSAQREAKKSNVTVTMTYLGQGHRGSSRDELQVLQQVNGGENICVFKGLLTPGGYLPEPTLISNFQTSSSSFLKDTEASPSALPCTSMASRWAESAPAASTATRPASSRGRRAASGCPGSPMHKSSTAIQLLPATEQQHKGELSSPSRATLRYKRLLPFLPKAFSSAVFYSSQSFIHTRKLQENVPPFILFVSCSCQDPNAATAASCPSSPLFTPTKTEKKSARRHVKDKAGGSADSGHPAAIKERRRKGQTDQSRSKDKTATSRSSPGSTLSHKNEGRASSARQDLQRQGSRGTHEPNISKTAHTLGETGPTLIRHCGDKTPKINIGFVFQDCLQDEEVLTKQKREKARESNRKSRAGDGQTDFHEQYVQMSSELEKSPSKHNWFQANMLQRRRLQKRLASGLAQPSSDAELSEGSDTVLRADGEPDKKEDGEGEEEKTLQNGDLQAQLEAMITVLSTSDEVEQLVLRNTDLTDQLLLIVADALKSSSSEVALLNLNLNLIGPDGARILLDVLKVKPQVKSLHLFGNRLCDDGALALLSGIAELQEQTSRAAAAANLSTGENFFSLVELDIGGNNLSGVGLKVLASYMRQHSHLQYLGLAQTGGPDLAVWKELFDSLKGNDWLTHIILDENNLGDPGVRLLADVLKSNPRLQMVDLDGNHVTDVGGNHLVEALLCRGHVPMRHLSLAENNISSGLMRRIREEVKGKSDRFRDEQCEK